MARPRAFAADAVARFVEIEGIQQATVLSAQAFTSLVPFLVVAAAIAPGESSLGDSVVHRFGLEDDSAERVRTLFASSGETRSAMTWASVLILILTTLSFTRALARVFRRSYGHEPGGAADAGRGLAWLAAFAPWVVLSSALRQSLEHIGGVAFAIALATATGFVVWLGTPMILLGERDWRRLAPGAIVSAVLGAALGLASSIYVPVLVDWSAERYGLIGIALTLQSWLLLFSLTVVVGAVAGGVLSRPQSSR